MTEKVEVRNLTLGSNHVGFDSLPNQLVGKSTQKGFIFNILCIGETGLGKSTLMNCLFNTNFDSTPSTHNLPCVQLNSNTYELQESNVTMKLTIVETAGFGDQINKEDSFETITNYIDVQFEAYLQEELKIRRALNLYHDTRIHVCLYFIAPTGHGLKSLDILCMKKLDSKVNIIPLIAKADTISKGELAKFKERINTVLNSNGIKVYQCPIDEDDKDKDVISSMNSHVPFAIIGSTEVIKVGNKLVRARKYPWGVVQIENEVHCDFTRLRECIIRTNMEDLRETTHKHYELYRKSRLEQMGFSDFDADNKTAVNFQQTYEKKMLSHQSDLENKEAEMKQRFIQKVKGKEAELMEAEKKFHAKFNQINDEYGRDRKILEDNLKQIEDEIAEFNILKLSHKTQLLSGHHTWSLGSSLGLGKKK